MGLLVCMVSMVCNDKSIQENCANFIMNMWPVSAVIIVGEELNTRAHTYTHTSVITHTHTHTHIYIYIYIYGDIIKHCSPQHARHTLYTTRRCI